MNRRGRLSKTRWLHFTPHFLKATAEVALPDETESQAKLKKKKSVYNRRNWRGKKKKEGSLPNKISDFVPTFPPSLQSRHPGKVLFTWKGTRWKRRRTLRRRTKKEREKCRRRNPTEQARQHTGREKSSPVGPAVKLAQLSFLVSIPKKGTSSESSAGSGEAGGTH